MRQLSVFLLFVLVLDYCGNAQQPMASGGTAITATDADTSTSRPLSVAEFLAMVRQFHPVARQAALLTDKAKANLLIARGSFDPSISSTYNRKEFDGKNYYSFFENNVKVPLWYGDVKGGYDRAYGTSINPEDRLPDQGLGYVGIELPLVKNMLIDKRRAALKEAQIYAQSNDAARVAMLNDLLLNALITYYDFCYAYANVQLFEKAVSLAEQRYTATQQLVIHGDKPAIDTTEALTILQTRQFGYNEAQLLWQQKRFELSAYLWSEDQQPVVLPIAIKPDSLAIQELFASVSLLQLESLRDQITQKHPEVRAYDFKLQQLQVERRVKLENLKPELNAGYNYLITDKNAVKSLLPQDNYKLGVSFRMPLSFTQARGEYQMTKLKLREVQLDRDWKNAQLIQKFNSTSAELFNLQQQVNLYQTSLKNYEQLFTGEQVRFLNGESTLFLVNSRETKMLEVAQKVRELQAKCFQVVAKLKWTAGILSAQ
ncbi:MAG: TolC family protein [Chitinophagales bacterium]